MEFAWSNNTPIGNVIFTLCFATAIFGCLTYLLLKTVKRKAPIAIYASGAVCFYLGYIFRSNAICALAIGIIVIDLVISLFINLGDLRKFMANPFKVTSAKAAPHKVEKIFDRDTFNRAVETAVISLSKEKIGAIMTFEMNASLKEIIKNGVSINAPVSAELLETIFYPGTRLHDGAVVIHGNEIIAANVFFTPTTKAFAGKYGSRHRAAIGISEISDAVTVVVSEETGRISFAVNGTLETVDQANFLRVFINLTSDKAK